MVILAVELSFFRITVTLEKLNEGLRINDLDGF